MTASLHTNGAAAAAKDKAMDQRSAGSKRIPDETLQGFKDLLLVGRLPPSYMRAAIDEALARGERIRELEKVVEAAREEHGDEMAEEGMTEGCAVCAALAALDAGGRDE